MSAEVMNPFSVMSPEKLDADEAERLFVEVFSDFPQVETTGNAVIVGARGSGKSMMFRCLLPDVMMKRNKCSFRDLPFVAFHVPIKNTQLNITELRRIDNHYASALINEHFFVTAMLIEICGQIRKYQKDMQATAAELKHFYCNIFVPHAEIAGCSNLPDMCGKYEDCFDKIGLYFRKLYQQFIKFVFSFSPNEDVSLPAFDMPLLSYRMFLHPFLLGIREFHGFPSGKNIHIFIDDADNLNKTQTQILNSWLGMRIQPSISLKVSTQIGKYKSYLSTDGTLVESPHDYQKIDISDKYTTSQTTYFKRVREIVEKRLAINGINKTAEQFFPVYAKQEHAIDVERRRLMRLWEEGKGHGNRKEDDALRYARPNYIKHLGGVSKSRSKYMYAGFEQLVHLSSGVVRVFLESASLMYDAARKRGSKAIEKEGIPYSLQDEVVRSESEAYLFSRFDELGADVRKRHAGNSQSDVKMLMNLIKSMGSTFFNILVSDKSERRVFSIALSNEPDDEIKHVLDLGVEMGYFQASTIGRKDGAGRTRLYIMNRMLAPQFNLDPTGFAGYLFVTNDALRAAMYNQRLLRDDAPDGSDPEQLTFFD